MRKPKDITGMRSGSLVAIEPTEKRRRGSVLWRCQCDCGKEILAEGSRITSGRVKSCGCSRKYINAKDLTGQRFGRLTAIRRLDQKSGTCYLWLCKCDCGNEVTQSVNSLVTGNTRSCGCMRSEQIRRRMEQSGTIVDHVNLVDDTYVERIRRTKLQKNNTSGCTGVQKQGNQWVAMITFQKKMHYLGRFSTLEEAVLARKKAEEEYFGEYLKKFDQKSAAKNHAS